MSEINLPFEEKYKIESQTSSGKKLMQEREKSLNNPEEFWAEKAEAIDWFKKWDKVLDDSNKPFYKWFSGGILNISHNALDRHVKTERKNKIAYIWEGEMGEVKTYTYEEFRDEVAGYHHGLRAIKCQPIGITNKDVGCLDILVCIIVECIGAQCRREEGCHGIIQHLLRHRDHIPTLGRKIVKHLIRLRAG